ncbi:hypothetical protein AB4144_33560 [Rhizobiaceae sp. 2RAB30]
MIEAGVRNDMTAETVASVGDTAEPERGACGGLCALCPNRERHAALRSALAIGEGEPIARKH